MDPSNSAIHQRYPPCVTPSSLAYMDLPIQIEVCIFAFLVSFVVDKPKPTCLFPTDQMVLWLPPGIPCFPKLPLSSQQILTLTSIQTPCFSWCHSKRNVVGVGISSYIMVKKSWEFPAVFLTNTNVMTHVRYTLYYINQHPPAHIQSLKLALSSSLQEYIIASFR